MSLRLKIIVSFSGLVLVIFTQACATTIAQPPRSIPSPSVVQTDGPNEVDIGRVVYSNNCLACHPIGAKGIGPDISGVTEDNVKMKVRGGGGGMPAFPESTLSDQQLNYLAIYISSK